MTRLNSSPLLPFHREILPNGATLLVKETRTVPLAAVDLWVRTGAACETPDENGISHFLEHLFFKGTPARPVGVMDREIKALGGYNNAATSYDFTHYYVVLPADRVDLAMEILFDALLNMELPPEEIDRERQVVLEEIARRDDSPLGKLYDDFLANIFSGTPYQSAILGTSESLGAIDRERFQDYRSRHYGAGNLHIAVSGAVEKDAIVDRASRLLADLEPSRAPSLPPVEENGANGKFEFEIEKDVQQTYLLLGMRAPSVQGTEEEIALDLLSTVLGDGRSSRLVSRLVEQSGLCSTVSAFIWPMDRVSMFGVEGCYQEEDEAAVLETVHEEIERVRRDTVPEEELEKAKTLMLTGYSFGLERAASMAGALGRNSANGRLDSVLDYPERVAAMTAERAREILNRCCPEGNHTLGFVRPEKGDNGK